MSNYNTIDKFGRKRKGKEPKFIRGHNGIGFKLTSDGNFDISGKRMCYLGEPIDEGDGVTRNYVDTHLARCVQDIHKAVHDSIDIIVETVKKHLEGYTHRRIGEIIKQMKEYIDIELAKTHGTIIINIKQFNEVSERVEKLEKEFRQQQQQKPIHTLDLL